MFNPEEYDSWYERHADLYHAELDSLKFILNIPNPKIEIGVGTGRFASQLDIEYGLEPDENMMKYAEKRGIRVVKGYGENIPFGDEFFNLVLISTSLPFFKDAKKVIREAHRILKKDGILVIAFIPRNSYFGKKYTEMGKKGDGRFKDARFYTFEEIENLISPLFKTVQVKSTLIGKSIDLNVKNGYISNSSFVVIKARKNI